MIAYKTSPDSANYNMGIHAHTDTHRVIQTYRGTYRHTWGHTGTHIHPQAHTGLYRHT